MKKAPRILDTAFTLLFSLAFALPCLMSFLAAGGEVAPHENRIFAHLPKPANLHEVIHKLPKDLDRFLNDHFGFRDFFVSIHHRLTTGPLFARIRNNVLVGKDGWLYWGNELAFSDIRGNKAFSEATLYFWLAELNERKEWLKSLGTELVVAIAPDKPSIYPEFLPDGIRAPGGRSGLEQLEAVVEKERPSWLVNLKHPILERKRAPGSPELYYKADSHWTPYGALAAYRAIMRRVRELGLRIPDSPIGEEHIHSDPNDHNAEFYFLPQEWNHLAPGYSVKHPALDCVQKSVVQPRADMPHIQSITEATTCGRGKGKVLVIKDSFIEKLRPFLETTFARVVYLNVGDQRIYSEKLVSAEKPDLVLYEIVERHMRLSGELWEQERAVDKSRGFRYQRPQSPK